MMDKIINSGIVDLSRTDPRPRAVHEADGRSRRLLLQQIAEIVPFSSLLDVGQGRWVEAAFDVGTKDVWGLDIGPEPAIHDPRARIHRACRGQRWVLERRFDMVVAFGADEGGVADCAAPMVDDLCALSDFILFSSGDPLEAAMSGAVRSWPEAWALLFRDAGYSCFDLFGRQPSLIDEPGLLPSQAVLFARRGSEAAERLDPWIADGLRRTYYTPDSVISLLEHAGIGQSQEIEEAGRSYRQSLDRIAAPLGSGFITKYTPVLRRLRRELDHARSMIAIEQRGGRITGERLGFAKGRDAERRRFDAEVAALKAERSRREDEFACATDQLNALIAGFRQAYFRHSMDRRSRLILFLLPPFLKGWWTKRYFDRAVDEIRRSVMFDADYYLTNNPDLKDAGVDPAEHYFTFGAREGRNPSARFDTTHYILEHLKRGGEGVNPLLDTVRSKGYHGQ